MCGEDDPTLLAERRAKLEALGPIPPWWRWLARRAWRRARATILAIDCSIVARMYRDIYSGADFEAIARRPHSSYFLISKEPYRDEDGFVYPVKGLGKEP